MNTNDKRFCRTQKNIENSFLSLLEKKSYSDITVGQIVSGARCNRNTFYLHFIDKRALLDSLNENAIASVRKRLMAGFPVGEKNGKDAIEKYIRSLLDYFEAEKELFLAMSRNNPAFYFMVQNAVRDGIVDSTILRGIQKESEAGLSAYSEYISAGICALVFRWLQSGFPERAEFERQLCNINTPASMVIIDEIIG